MKKILLLIMMAVISACAQKQAGDTLVVFVEQEDGVDPYQTRMIITEDFVRIDDGEGDKDFVLFDRKNMVVQSVTSSEKTILKSEPAKRSSKICA